MDPSMKKLQPQLYPMRGQYAEESPNLESLKPLACDITSQEDP